MVADIVAVPGDPASDIKANEPVKQAFGLRLCYSYTSFLSTQVVIDRWSCTTVVFSGSASRAPRRSVSSISITSSTR